MRQSSDSTDDPLDTIRITAGSRPTDLSTEEANRSGLYDPESLAPGRAGRPTSIERLDWVRGHLARVDRHGLTTAERKEMIRLLVLIQNDVSSLLSALTNAADEDPHPREF